MPRKKLNNLSQKAVDIFKKNAGILRTNEAINKGIHPVTLYSLRDSGLIVQISRGVYRLADMKQPGNPDLITVAMRIPNGVICLISALSIHDITTQIPHEVHIALPHGAEEPRLDYPPVRTYRFTGMAFTEGIETHKLNNISVKVYNIEKTLADCFKFRNKIGLDTAIEALRLYRERRKPRVDDLLHFATICRVEKIMRPYLEAIL